MVLTVKTDRAEVPVSERVVFGQSVEALVRTCGDHTPPEIVAAFKECGIDLAKLQVAYPLASYVKAVERLRQLRFPNLPDPEAYYRIGRGFIDRYSTTLVGRALLAMLPVLGTKRVMGRLTQNFRSATNYVTAEATEAGPTHYRVRIHPIYHPDYYRGILTAGLEVSGARNLAVRLSSFADHAAIFDVTWAG